MRARLYTVEGVLVEAAHVLDAGTTLVPPTEPRLGRACALMNKYRDAPMDLVDALLVVTAEDEGTARVLTLDRRGFGTYRIRGRKRFDIAP